MQYIKIKQKHWQKKRINHGVSWMGAIKIGLFSPNLKKTLNDIKSDTSSTEKTAKILSDYF